MSDEKPLPGSVTRSPDLGRVCGHGNLARSCVYCEDRETLAALRAERDATQAALNLDASEAWRALGCPAGEISATSMLAALRARLAEVERERDEARALAAELGRGRDRLAEVTEQRNDQMGRKLDAMRERDRLAAALGEACEALANANDPHSLKCRAGEIQCDCGVCDVLAFAPERGQRLMAVVDAAMFLRDWLDSCATDPVAVASGPCANCRLSDALRALDGEGTT